MATNLTNQVRNIAAGHDRGRQRRPDASRSRSTRRARSSSSSGRSTRWSTSSSSFADEVTRVAREVGTEGKLGGQAEVQGVVRHVARPDREREPLAANLTDQVRNIAQVTTAVAQRRPVAEDHGRRPGRDPRAEEHDQHDGRPALVASPTRSRASRARWAPRASSAARPRVEGVSGTWRGPHRQREPDGREPDRPGAQHRPGHDRGGQRRPDPEDHGRRPRRDRSSSRTRSTRWSTSCARSPTRSRASRARSAPRASSAARPRCEGVSGTWRGPHREREPHGVEPDRPGAHHRRRSRPRSPTAT